MISIFFQGFVKRQKTFTQEWFFECGCPRCSDPTGPSMSFYLNFVQILSKYKKLTFSNFIYSHIWVPLAPNMFALRVWGGTGSSLWLKCLEEHITKCSEGHFLTFPVCFLIPIIFSNLNYNCFNILDLRNLQEQVKKAFCFKNWSDLLLFE